MRTFSYKSLVKYYKVKRYYDCGVSEVVHGIKRGEERMIQFAAIRMSRQVRSEDVLVPIPGRNGKQGHAFLLACEIQKWSGARVYTGLRGKKRESLYDLKKQGGNSSDIDFGFYLKYKLPEAKKYWVVDNVIGTGATMNAARRTIGKYTRPLVYAVDDF